MGETTNIEFTERGYRQLVMALREAVPQPDKPEVAEIEERVLISDGETGFVDPQGLIRWVKPDRVTEVPDTWLPLLVGRSRRERQGR